jgi:hypothetical protein
MIASIGLSWSVIAVVSCHGHQVAAAPRRSTGTHPIVAAGLRRVIIRSG